MGAPEAGRVGSTDAGRGEFYRGGLLLMIVLSLVLRPFCEIYGMSFSVSNTINIITYTYV